MGSMEGLREGYGDGRTDGYRSFNRDSIWDREELRLELEWWTEYQRLIEAGLTEEEKIERAREVLRNLKNEW